MLDKCFKLYFAGSGELEFEEFCILASRFLVEEEEVTEAVLMELKEAFRLYDKEGEYSDNGLFNIGNSNCISKS